MDATVLLVLAGGALAVAGICLTLVILRRQRREREQEVHHFRCPGCQRRLRFYLRQVGHSGKCSYCGHKLTFPPVSQALD
jgi:hypothetical protein